MKKNLYSSFLLVFLFALGTSMLGQEKTAKPMMKITVEDGKVVSAVPLDNNGNPDRATMHYLTDEGVLDTRDDPSRSILVQDTLKHKLIQTSGEELPFHQEKIEKGNILSIVEDKAVFDLDLMQANVNYTDVNGEKEGGEIFNEPQAPEDGWELIMQENFEGAFPSGNWSVYYISGNADAYWGDNSYRSHSGSWSMFCAADGTAGVVPPATYPANMESWAVYGPFDLTNSTAAQLEFSLWLESESDHDYFRYYASADGTSWSGYMTSGSTGDAWEPRVLDLTDAYGLDVTGSSTVYVAFRFTSDASIGYQGAFVDDLVLWSWNTTLAGPDLVPWDVTLSSYTWNVGDSYTLDLEVANVGDAYGYSFATRAYLSSDNIITDADYQLGSDIFYSALAPGASQTVYGHPFTCPSVPDGSYYVGFIADYYDDCPESDETNNIAYWGTPVTVVSGAPDLAPWDVALSSYTWNVGDSYSMDLEVANVGDAYGDPFVTRAYLSADNIISDADDQLGGDIIYGAIAPGAFQTVYGHPFTCPNVADGSYYVGFIADYYDTNVESDETNNIAYWGTPVTVVSGAPDLTPWDVALSSYTWNVGDSYTLDLEVANIGDAYGDPFVTRAYLSDNTSISDADDQLGGDINYGSLAPGATQTVYGHPFTCPNVADGSYYVGFIVDYYDTNVESDETNNIAYWSTPVTVTTTNPSFTISATVQPAGSGTVSGTGTYTLNQTATLVATPATGYEFVYWTENGSVVSYQQSYAFTVTSDRSLVANFQPVALQVTTEINPPGWGTASGGGSYPYGSAVNLSAVPATGYEFVNWTILGAVVSTDPNYTFVVYENTVATANFTVATLTVTVVAVPVEGGTISGGGSYFYGETAVLQAYEASPYEFEYWADQFNMVVSYTNPYSFMVVEDITLRAVFLDHTGIGDYEVQNFELYPNPVSDYLYVKVNVELSESVVVSLYDVSGKVVTNYKGLHAFKDVLELKTSHLIPGVYFIKITDEDTDTRFTGKVIKK